jgi:hypothetical protein
MNHSFAFKLFLVLLLTQGLVTSGQSPIYCVYFTTGNIKYTSVRADGVKPAIPHTLLSVGDKLMVLDNISGITLLARDTSYLRLEAKGNYTISQLDKMPRTRITDTIMIQYLSFFWEETSRAQPATIPTAATGATILAARLERPAPRNVSIVLGPRPGYSTSFDSLIFRWNNVTWARKYFLRLRNSDGQLCYDSVVADTEAVVHFPGRMPIGNTYSWVLDIVGESGRLQFADSGHIVLVNEFAIIPHLPTIPMDSIGGLAPILERIEQYENAGCIKEAEALFYRLTNDFPSDRALDKLYIAFRRRNYF